MSVKTDYYRTPAGEYAVQCQVLEQNAPLIDLTLTVPSEEEAQTISGNWAKKNQELYALIMEHLL